MKMSTNTKQARKHQALLNTLLENVTTVQARFAANGPGGKLYTYKVPTRWGVKAGDELVVDTPVHGMQVAAVVSVDPVPAFDTDAEFTYKWAVQKVDRSGYDAQLKREALFLEQLAVVERAHVRQDTLAKATAALSGEALEAFQKAVVTLTGEASQTAGTTAPDATAAQ
jgi:hypothetical protein